MGIHRENFEIFKIKLFKKNQNIAKGRLNEGAFLMKSCAKHIKQMKSQAFYGIHM